MTPPTTSYVHSHDTGRWVQPDGYPVPTPDIQHLADQGVLIRQAFSGAPVGSVSRAALLTGEWCHVDGMTGLAHRGWPLEAPSGSPLSPPLRRQSDSVNDDWVRRDSEIRPGTGLDLVPAVPS